jgi:surface protein
MLRCVFLVVALCNVHALHMFGSASAFDQPLSFDTSSVTDMGYMFGGRFANLDSSSITTTSGMFRVRSARALTPPPSDSQGLYTRAFGTPGGFCWLNIHPLPGESLRLCPPLRPLELRNLMT